MKHTLTPVARKLRKDTTDAERLLWHHLRTNQLGGLKFRRQEPIGKFIVDFVCTDKNVIIELDGGHHGDQAQEKKDEKRTAFLDGRGYTVLRFSNNYTLNNTLTVLEIILSTCMTGTIPQWR